MFERDAPCGSDDHLAGAIHHRGPEPRRHSPRDHHRLRERRLRHAKSRQWQVAVRQSAEKTCRHQCHSPTYGLSITILSTSELEISQSHEKARSANLPNVRRPPGDGRSHLQMALDSLCPGQCTSSNDAAVDLTAATTACAACVEYWGLRPETGWYDPQDLNPTPWAIAFNADFLSRTTVPTNAPFRSGRAVGSGLVIAVRHYRMPFWQSASAPQIRAEHASMSTEDSLPVAASMSSRSRAPPLPQRPTATCQSGTPAPPPPLAPFAANGQNGPCMALGPANPPPNATVLAWLATLHLPACTAPAAGPAPVPINPAVLAVEFWQTIPLPTPHPDDPAGLRRHRQAGIPGDQRDPGAGPVPTTDPPGGLDHHRARDLPDRLGDGSLPTWTGPFAQEGRPYPDGNIVHTYDNTGTATVTVQEVWTATWALGPAHGVLGALRTSATIAGFPVQQIQAVLTG